MNEVERRGTELVKQALNKRASDIHFHPKEKMIVIQFRINGALYEYGTMQKPFYERLLSHFKFQAKMDIGEKRRPQSGALNLSLHGQNVSVRLSTLPTPYLESLALRLLPQDQQMRLDELFLFPTAGNRLATLLKHTAGLMLLTGTTGSGKTTTIYALLHEAVKQNNRRVITVEDPIEKLNDAFTQMEVNEKAGITFAEGFKASLRHDPDLLMIGEIRDAKTAKIAIQAALSGHFVISSMHAKNPIGALYRLREFGIPFIDIQQTVIAVATQMLVNMSCQHCGSDCQSDCKDKGASRRAAVLELLSGSSLEQVFSHIEAPTNPLPTYPTLKDEITKGVALGLLPNNAYQQWIEAS